MDFSQFKDFKDFKQKMEMDANTAFDFLKEELKKRGYELKS